MLGGGPIPDIADLRLASNPIFWEGEAMSDIHRLNNYKWSYCENAKSLLFLKSLDYPMTNWRDARGQLFRQMLNGTSHWCLASIAARRRLSGND